MARPDGRIEKGQRINAAISAKAWNRAQEAADIVLGANAAMVGGQSTAFQKAANVVLIKNDTGVPVPMFGVLGISGVVIDPSGGELTGSNTAAEKARQFARSPVLLGGLPSASLPFAIAMEPMERGQTGRAALSGAFPCRVEIVSVGHNFAGAREGDVTQLRTVDCGMLHLVWKQAGTGLNKWAFGSL